MANANPPDEIDDSKAPADGDIDAPDAYTLGKKVGHGNEQQHYQDKRAGKSENPPFRRTAGEHDRADFVGDGSVVVSGPDDGSGLGYFGRRAGSAGHDFAGGLAGIL